jgi:DNA-binding transcriptional MerR regulator
LSSPDGSEDLVKLYYRIGEVAEIVGVETHVLRYWETEFRSIRPQKSHKGRRVYTRRDVQKLLEVKDLLYGQGFTIAGARKRLRDRGLEPRAPEDPALLAAGQLKQTLMDIRQDVVALMAELSDDEPT